MKFLFQYNNFIACVARVTVMFQIFLNHIIRYISSTPNSVTYRPKMSAPVTFRKSWKLFLQSARSSTFQTLDYITDAVAGRIFNMDMHMVFTHNTLQYPYIFRIANLFYQVPATRLDVTLQNMIPVFRNPYNMSGKARNAVRPMTLFIVHELKLRKCVATESLALKRIVSTNEL